MPRLATPADNKVYMTDADEASSGTSRLFGSAVASVRKHWGETEQSSRRVVGRMHSDIGVHHRSAAKRTVTDAGGRTVTCLPATSGRRALLCANESSYGSLGRPLSLGRRSYPYGEKMAGLQRHRTAVHDPDNEEWQHDLYEGHVASNPGSEIFVRNLPSSVTANQLQSLFGKVGVVVAVKLDQGPLPTAKISFLKKNTAADAVDMFTGHKLHGKPIKVCVLDTRQTQPSVTNDNDDGNDGYLPALDSLHRGHQYQQTFRRTLKEKKTKASSFLRSDVPRTSVFDRLC